MENRRLYHKEDPPDRKKVTYSMDAQKAIDIIKSKKNDMKINYTNTSAGS